jgi:hypothetical protein
MRCRTANRDTNPGRYLLLAAFMKIFGFACIYPVACRHRSSSRDKV